MFHYTSWPDRGVPDYAGPLLALRKVVMSKHKHTKGPILVHCRQVNETMVMQYWIVEIIYVYKHYITRLSSKCLKTSWSVREV